MSCIHHAQVMLIVHLRRIMAVYIVLRPKTKMGTAKSPSSGYFFSFLLFKSAPVATLSSCVVCIEGVHGLHLPREVTLPTGIRTRLGVFRSNVLKLLARDPAERPSMEEFCKSCA